MAEHFRDYLDPEIDRYAAAVLEPERNLAYGGLVRCSSAILTAIGGEHLSSNDDGQRWGFPYGTGHQAVIEIRDERVVPALARYKDVGLFYTYTGDAEPLWVPDTSSTYVPEDVDTGNPV